MWGGVWGLGFGVWSLGFSRGGRCGHLSVQCVWMMLSRLTLVMINGRFPQRSKMDPALLLEDELLVLES